MAPFKVRLSSAVCQVPVFPFTHDFFSLRLFSCIYERVKGERHKRQEQKEILRKGFLSTKITQIMP